MALRIIFMGTPQYAVPTLTRLVESGYQVVAVYSQPPRPAGRGMEPKNSPVHLAAEQLGIPVFTPVSLRNDEEQKQFAAHDADVCVVVAYGLILPKPILDAPKYGCFNGHASLLPRWRGAAPIQRAIMAGDEKTGVMVMKMEAGLDTGPVAMTHEIAITPDMTAGELHDELMMIGADLMVKALDLLEKGNLALAPQDGAGVTHASKIEKSETRIDWNRSATDIHNHIRGLSPFPGAWCEMEFSGKPVRVKILATEIRDNSGEPGTVLDNRLTIACGTGAVGLSRLQRAGKQPALASEFLRGNDLPAGTRLT